MNEQESTRQVDRETQTTERFELQHETGNIVQQDASQQAGVTLSGRYGVVQGSAYAASATSTSSVQSAQQATAYGKEVMERALERIIERTRAQRTVTTIVEHEDTAEHTLANSESPADHIVGVYRWLDKLYFNKVVNYGKRLMFEFVVPEPAAFHVYSRTVKADGSEKHQDPPDFDLKSYEDITLADYDVLAVRYGALDVKAPPEPLRVAAEVKADAPAEDPWRTWVTKIIIPDGYQADQARVSVLMSAGSGHYVTMYVGGRYWHGVTSAASDLLPLDQHTGEVPVVARMKSTHHTISVEVLCSPTTTTIENWKIETFAALKAAHQRLVDDYNRWLNQQQVGVLISGNNTLLNRKTEQLELKKHCIELLTGQRFEAFDALQPNVPTFGYPEFRFNDAQAEGRYIQFFEQAFEWENMTYLFYPYFWGRKREWLNILKRDDSDPLFMKFLQAGAARVLVPVRPAYDEAMLHYLSSGGEIWLGEDVPAPNDPLYVSIIDELKEADGSFPDTDPQAEHWISKVPTNLVYLTHGGSPADLPDYSADLLPTP
ncbi:MAG: hypothetical protein JNM31_00790 [Flavobacteriales bacterium]|nr:hypothetical protein [Flavobacteriales bacterium]